MSYLTKIASKTTPFDRALAKKKFDTRGRMIADEVKAKKVKENVSAGNKKILAQLINERILSKGA